MVIREPAFAGQFYPADPKTLGRAISSFLRKPDSLMEAKAVLVPHAGYIYSGSVAGAVFSTVRMPERLVMLGPNHTGLGKPLSLFPSGAWRTPLGTVSIDEEINQRLLAECPILHEDLSAHLREHSLEVQIPFLQMLLRNFRFAAICVGTNDYTPLETLGHALGRVLLSSKEPALLVVSSDMTHYKSASEAAKQDRLAIDQILAVEPKGLFQVVTEEDISMCGIAPAVAVLTACRDLGASGGQVIQYANSGDVSRDYTHVVAYAGLAIT